MSFSEDGCTARQKQAGGTGSISCESKRPSWAKLTQQPVADLAA
ncbi:hypothetical protein HK44_023775 [Pseudomonas fluorescens HK44]|uniref:Uncharacterized protein n=1 Tax=Pseudomonas fluorescens HK44 TaxID=1042209 RepID=A0A010TEY3_PSEFL|nr:hypothetical protein HK44_023775 [Pseudomonas fluorescens HK44]